MESSLVYSTMHGRMCPGCERPVAQCACSKKEPVFKGDGIIRVSRETKGRKGKCVSLVPGVPLGHDGLLELAKRLKQKCGSGGTIKDGVIEIQGDHRDTIVKELAAEGYPAKKAGG
jgi:translation initiation factor 1